MEIVNTSKNKVTFHCKRSIDTAKSNNFATSKKVDASSMMALDANGRALVNLSKMSFRGNINNSSLKEYLEDLGLSEYIAEEILKLPAAQKNEAIGLFQEGIIPESLIVEFVQKDEEIKSKMLELIQNGISSIAAIDDIERKWDGKNFIYLSKEEILKECDKITDMINKGIDTDGISLAISNNIELSDEIANRASYFIKRIKSSPELAMKNIFYMYSIAEVVQNDDIYERAVTLFNMGITDLHITETLAKNEENFKKGIEYLNSGYKEDDIGTLSGVSDESCLEKIKELMAKYKISADLAKFIAESGEVENYENRLKKLLKEQIAPDKHLIELDGKLLDRVLQLVKDGCCESEIEASIMEFGFERRLERLAEKNEENNKKWNDFINSSPNNAHYNEELTKQDIYFLKSNIFENQFYSPNEYVGNFIRLKNLKTINGENILGCESFGNKIKTNGLGDFAAAEEDMLYRNIEAILSIDPKSQKAKYIQRILQLIQDGKINPSAFRKLTDLNDLHSIESMLIGIDFDIAKTKSSDWDISNNLINDIELVGNEEFDIKNYLDRYIPQYKSEEDGIKNSKIGDAFILDSENYIRIKTDEDKSETVKLKKETYAKLFPPVERFLSSQQIMGNCYCIETLMSMYCNNNTRINLLKHIKEDDDGNITIQMGNYKPVIFKDGKLPENEDRKIYSSGADGYKLFEYAYSCALVEDKIKEARGQLSDDKLTEFNNFINLNPDNFFIFKDDNGEIKWSTYKEAIEKGYYKKASMNPFGIQPYKTFNNLLLGNGGLQNDVYRKLGYKSEIYTGGMITKNTSRKELIKSYKEFGLDVDDINPLNKAGRLIKSPNFLKNHQVQIGLGGHAYSLTKETDNNGNAVYYLYNPHNQGFPIRFSDLDKLLSKVTQVIIIEINS